MSCSHSKVKLKIPPQSWPHDKFTTKTLILANAEFWAVAEPAQPAFDPLDWRQLKRGMLTVSRTNMRSPLGWIGGKICLKAHAVTEWQNSSEVRCRLEKWSGARMCGKGLKRTGILAVYQLRFLLYESGGKYFLKWIAWQYSSLESPIGLSTDKEHKTESFKTS